MRSIVLVAATVALACSATTAPPPTVAWTPLAATALDPNQSAQLARAKAAQSELATTLMGRLSAAMDAGGPTAAIAVCRDVAGELTGAVGARHGVRLGRSSQRLRNPSNAAPSWAAGTVAGDASELTLLAASDGRLGVLLPIRLQPQCTMCHGPAAAIADEVRAAISASYPSDQATGFAAGDLRGWFWVEVPAS